MNTTSNSSSDLPTVFVIDDDRFVLESICATLKATGLNIKPFASAKEFLTSVVGPISGCVVTDVMMPGFSGLELQKALSDRGLHIPVIVITGQAEVAIVLAAMKLGAFDFLEKPFRPQQLRDLVCEAVKADALQIRELRYEKRLRDRLALLSVEERLVFEGIASGKTAKVISQELGLSLRTIQFRRSSAMEKLHATRSELVEIVLQNREAAAHPEPNLLPGDFKRKSWFTN